MKRYILFLITIFSLFITNVYAKDKCTIVNGTGNQIGDEIACGEEHFYITSISNDEIKMLAKYNLYVGSNYNKFVVPSNTYTKVEVDSEENELNNRQYYFNGELKTSDIYYDTYDEYDLISDIIEYYNFSWEDNYVDVKGDVYEEGGKYYYNITYKFYPRTIIETTDPLYGKQNSIAIGVYGEKNNAVYPIVATLYPIDDYFFDPLDEYIDFDGTYYNKGYIDFKYISDREENASIHLTYYKNYLNNNYSIDNVDLPTIKNINEIYQVLKGESLPLEYWYDNAETLEDDLPYPSIDSPVYDKVGSLKDKLGDEYNWLWSTSYWTRTLKGENVSLNYDYNEHGYNYYPYNTFIYFISTSGDVCYSSLDCSLYIPRAGLRPLVSINPSNIYKVTVEDSTNGLATYTISNNVVTIDPNPNEGYEVDEIKVYDSNGVLIEVNNNTFTKPNDDVNIIVTYKKLDNPKTGTTITIISLIVLFLTTLFISLTKDKKIYNI